LIFNQVNGTFCCNNNKLLSLKGCPKYVGENFIALNCNIKDFKYFPIKVGNYISLTGNPVNYFYYSYIDEFDNIELFNEFKILDNNIVYLNRLRAYFKMNNIDGSKLNFERLERLGYIIK